MNAYILVVIIGFFLKLRVSYFALQREKSVYHSQLKVVLLLTAIPIVTFSIPQLFMVADGASAMPFGLPRETLFRWYLVHSVACAVPGFYMIIAVFFPQILARKEVRYTLQALGVVIFLVFFWFITVGDSVVQNTGQPQVSLREDFQATSNKDFLLVTRTMIAVVFLSLFFHFIRRYKNADSHRSQIISFYALVALFLSVIETTLVIFMMHPLLLSLKGVFFTLVVFLACSDREFVDMRSTGVITKEAKVNRQLNKTFIRYSNSELTHKQAMQDVERIFVSYKLQKEPTFIAKDGSPLPELADNMGMRLSTLYDLINRLGIQRPSKN